MMDGAGYARVTRGRIRNNIGIESNVPQGGVIWVFALKK